MTSRPGSPNDPKPEDDPGAEEAVLDAAIIGGVSPAADAEAGAAAARAAVLKIDDEGPDAPGAKAGVARNTVLFSVATGLSRVAGLAREILAASYFGTSGAASAFTIAFQLPNLVRGLFADAALSAAFVPVFAEFLEQKRRREAILLASTLFWIILLVLGALSAIFIFAAGVLIPLFIPGDNFTPQLIDLAVGLSQVLFPIVVLLGINGLLVGIVNSYHHFTIPALAPLVWNVVIIGALIALRPMFSGDDQIYAYAIGVLLGTVVQLLMVIPVLAKIDFRLKFHFNWRDPGVTRVLKLMIPVTIGLGVINVDLVINSVVGALISDSAPRAIDAAFRIYMLPQGIFSVALATVLFPSLSRLVARGDTDGLRALVGTGTRQNLLLLVPAAAATIALAVPITELIYQYGAFNAASTAANLAVNAVVSLLLYKPLGIAGPVIGTVVASAGMTAAQMVYLRRQLGGSIEGRETLIMTVKVILSAILLVIVSRGIWLFVDGEIGSAGPLTRLIGVLPALAAGLLVYLGAVKLLRIREADQILHFFTSRLRGLRS